MGVFEGTLGDGPRKVERYKFMLSAKYPDPEAGFSEIIQCMEGDIKTDRQTDKGGGVDTKGAGRKKIRMC